MQTHPRSILSALGLALAAGLLIASSASASVNVTVSKPADGATVPLTFNVQASATTTNAGATVTGWHIYVDGADKYGTAGPTSSINTNVTTTNGTHTVLVRAWDSTGDFGDQTLDLDASSAAVLVNVSTPANNATVPLTFNVQASATTSNSGASVTGWHIYIDSVDKYGTSGPTSSINTSITTTNGTHTLLVRAWDSTGAFGDQTLTIDAGVTGGGGLAGHHHVVVVAFENHSYETVVGSSSASYFNSLISSYGLATNFYANGHDSLSQYWWMLDGTNNCDGNVNDCKSNPTTLVATADSIIREVINHGQTWKQYTESLPSRGFIVEEPDGIAGSPSGTYYSRHAPAIYLSDVRQGTPTNQAVNCSGEPNGYDSTKQACNVVNFADSNNGFIADLNAGRLPNFSLVIPNGCDDAHDCGNFSTADSWLRTNIGALLSKSYFQPGGDGLLILWFDEGSLSGLTDSCGTNIGDNRSSSTSCSGGGGRIAVVVAAPDLVAGNFKSSVYFQHPSVTKSVCEALGIPVPSPAAGAADFSGFF